MHMYSLEMQHDQESEVLQKVFTFSLIYEFMTVRSVLHSETIFLWTAWHEGGWYSGFGFYTNFKKILFSMFEKGMDALLIKLVIALFNETSCAWRTC